MKTVIWILLPLLSATLSLEAQIIEGTAFYYTHLEGTFSFHQPVTAFDESTQTAVIDMDQVKVGYNMIACDSRGGRQLYLIAKEQPTGKTICGFAIQDQQSRQWTNINCIANAVNKPKQSGEIFGCQPGWEPQWRCHANESGTLQLCYFFCSDSRLVLRLPSGV